MARLWYPRRFHVQIIAPALAEQLFSNYDSPMPTFEFHGGECHGGALLESALALPRQTFAGRYLYRTWYEKAGALLRSLIKNHPLVDGNKRIAVATTFVFLLMNGRFLFTTNEKIVQFALAIAASEPDMSWRTVGRWIRTHSYEISHLQQLLSSGKESAPEHSRDFEEASAMVTAFWKWAKEGKKLERRIARAARREGFSLDAVWAEVVDQMST